MLHVLGVREEKLVELSKANATLSEENDLLRRLDEIVCVLVLKVTW